MPIRPRYSERQRASVPRSVATVNESTKNSLNAILQSSMFNVSSGYGYSTMCQHCFGTYTPNIDVLRQRARVEIGQISDLDVDELFPTDETSVILDLIEVYFEFILEYVGKMEHCRGGQNCAIIKMANIFTSSINRVFERDKIAYELTDGGQIARIGAPILSEVIQSATFVTGDSELDGFLETAKDKFISRDPEVRRDGLEKLWDAWERLKTLEVPGDKRTSTAALLDRAAAGDAPLRERLETEARELTDIGNDFMIRHSETDRHPLTDDRHVDYLFHRMFSLVYLLLDATGRVGRGGA